MKGRLFLFGTLKLMAWDDFPGAADESGHEKLYDVGSPKTQSLLAYFALHPNQPIERRRLAFLLWPRAAESAARRNLRQYLHRLRRTLDPLDLNELLQDMDGGRIIFRPGEELWIDVSVFEKELARVSQNLQNAAEAPPHLLTLLELYGGELLPDNYDDWVIPLRAHWQQQYLQLLQKLIKRAKKLRAFERAIPLAERLVQADPLAESSHRLLMECHYLNGDRACALRQYERCRQVLQDELDAAPMPGTVALYRRIRDGDFDLSEEAEINQHPKSKIQREASFGGNRKSKIGLAGILPPSIEAAAPPFISRQPEIAQLDQALLRTEQGYGQLLLIRGESGVGKTRLAHEWTRANARRIALLEGHCREFEAVMPYHPLSEALRAEAAEIDWTFFDPPPAWLGGVAQILPELAARYPDLPRTLAADGATDRHHLSESLGRFILTLAHRGKRPLVLFLDDLQWADEATWQVLAYLGWRCAHAPLLIIGTCQWELVSPFAQRIVNNLQRRPSQIAGLDLLRFSPEETRQLAAFLMDEPHFDRKLLSRLYQETEGNPLFIIEMVNAWFVADSSAGARSGRGSEVAAAHQLPAGVKSVIEARLSLLSEESRILLSSAAAIGRTFNFRVLAKACDLPEDDILEALEDWLARGLVIESAAGYDFSHDKIRAVAYEEMSRARRRIVHRRIALALEEYLHDPDLHHPARLAYHYNLSDEAKLALPYLLKAGDMALAVRSYREAREFGMQAMALLRRTSNRGGERRDQERLDLNLQLAVAYAFSGEIDRALPILQEAERLARKTEDEARLARIFHRSAQLLWLRGQCRLADEYARRMLRGAEELDDAQLLHAALRMLGRVAIALSIYDDAIAHLLRYVKLDASLHPPPDLPVVYGYLAVAYSRVGFWQRALDAGRRGVELAEEAKSSSALAVANMHLAFIYSERQHWASCLDAVERAELFCEETGFSPHCFMARSLMGRAKTYLGDAEEGLEILLRALNWAKETNYRVFAYLPQIFLAEAWLQLNQAEKALSSLEEAEPLVREADDRWARGVLLRLRAEAGTRFSQPEWLAVESDLIESTNLLRQARARPDLARTYLALRRLYDRAGRTAWSVDCHFRATTIFDELEMVDELRAAQGYAAGERKGAVVIPNLILRGPNQ